jgi:hypothetical protein
VRNKGIDVLVLFAVVVHEDVDVTDLLALCDDPVAVLGLQLLVDELVLLLVLEDFMDLVPEESQVDLLYRLAAPSNEQLLHQCPVGIELLLSFDDFNSRARIEFAREDEVEFDREVDRRLKA